MYKIYDKWSQIAEESFESKQDVIDFNNVDHIVFAGMGGSGAVGDILASILSKTKIHVNVVKGYLLPQTIDSNTLIVTISVSGNTAETMSVLDSANKMDSKIIAFSSGGKMQQYCAKNIIEYRNIPQYHSPRASLPSYLYTILKVLHSILDLKQNDVIESIKKLEKLNRNISSSNLAEDNQSLNLAKWISGIPMIYYPYGLQAAAIRFKNSLQENGKIHAMAEDVIESCHNGIVSWEKTSDVQPILIRGLDDYIKTKERLEILKKYFDINKIPYKEIFSVKGDILTKLINLIYLFDYATIYHAVLNKIDPSPIKSIDFVKSQL